MPKKSKKKPKGKNRSKSDGSKIEKKMSTTKGSNRASEIPIPEIIAETIVDYLHEVEGDSPINVKWENLIKIRTAPIEWTNYNVTPLNLSMRNTAFNVVLTGTWMDGQLPQVCKGPMTSNYDFAQIHFHWGPDSTAGSDHSADGDSYPFEIHSVFYKSSAGSIEKAKKELDGIVIFCYLYKTQDTDNEKLRPITDNIEKVVIAYTKVDLPPTPLEMLLEGVTDNYIVYLGSMQYKAVYGVTFIICRDTQGISHQQLSKFRDLKDRHENPMILKTRELQPLVSRNVFLVNPKPGTHVLRALPPPPVSTKRRSQSGKRSMNSVKSDKKTNRTKRSGKHSMNSAKSGKRKARKNRSGKRSKSSGKNTSRTKRSGKRSKSSKKSGKKASRTKRSGKR